MHLPEPILAPGTCDSRTEPTCRETAPACGVGAGDSLAFEIVPIHHQLLVAFSYSNRAMRARTRQCGLMPGQPKVLEHLALHDGCTQKEIAQSCVMDKSTVTSVLGRMEDAGLIERRSKAGDRRVVAVFLTEKGRSAASDVLDCRSEVDDIAWQGLDTDERRRLSHLLDQVIWNLQQHEQEDRA